jgi:hypothetical protein
VTEFCPKGSLYDNLRAASKFPVLARRLDWKKRLDMASCIPLQTFRLVVA